MKQLTKLWKKIVTNLEDLENDDSFYKDLADKFDEIIELKDVNEFRNIQKLDWMNPDLFNQMISSTHRAFIEGYLLGRAEDKAEQVSLLRKCFKTEIPRCSKS